MQKVKELLSKITEKLDKEVGLILGYDGSWGIVDSNARSLFHSTSENVEQELEKYLELCKE